MSGGAVWTVVIGSDNGTRIISPAAEEYILA